MSVSQTSREPIVILLVEDNPAHAELVLRSLEGHPLVSKMYHVADGEAALDYLLRRGSYVTPELSPRPHVILLDLRLPRVDGLEVLKEIKSIPEIEKIPTVILTTSAAEQDVSKAYEYHANSYLVKPIDFDEFTNLMGQIGSYWLEWNYYPWSEAEV